MSSSFQSEYATLQEVILKHPREAFVSQPIITREWQELHYLSAPDLDSAIREYDAFTEILSQNGVMLHLLPRNNDTTLDSIFTRDAAVTTDQGMILCNMGKDKRKSEPGALEDFFNQNKIKVLGRIEPPGTLEGGDVAWISPAVVGVGLGYRTNEEGIRQFKRLVQNTVEEVIVFHAPHYQGPNDVFHLMSVFSPVDKNLAVVYSPLMPVSFRNKLLYYGYQLIEVPEREFLNKGCNVLAIAPRQCIMLKGNDATKKGLIKAGAEVIEYEGHEISQKGSGGPTCLTRPLQRLLPG